MKRAFLLTMAAVISAKPALAADFGRVRWPDWMDGYIFLALGATGLAFLLVLITKPRGMSVSQARTARIGILPRVFFLLLQLSFFAMMGLIFWGMYLARAGG